MKMVKNLNELGIPHECRYEVPLEDYSFKSGNMECYFKNLQSNLISKIKESDAVFGCIAWLTDFEILDAISETGYRLLIVQKEDFLRPDSNSNSDWYDQLREKYYNLTKPSSKYSKYINDYDTELARHHFDRLCEMSYNNCDEMNGVRCVGNHNSEKKPASPRMHNKFLVFAKVEHLGDDCGNGFYAKNIIPYAVWTGSYNFTRNGGNSFENAFYVKDEIFAKQYFNEFQQISCLSEPLDWEKPWVYPEYRIGS
mgnify:CR=1 FL=1|tara:strand:- start:7584 stop:8345 length:762 start_codon:yes stop_codon:yes gene_type:complete